MTTRHGSTRARLAKLTVVSVVLLSVVLAAPVFAFVSKSMHGIIIPKLNHGSAKVGCPSGEHVAFGGLIAQFDSLNDAIVLPTGMRRTPDGKWAVYGQSASASRGARLTAVAYCNRAKGPIAEQKTVSVGGGRVGSAVATCPAGTVVVAGGFNTRAFPNAQAIAAMQRITDGSWRVSMLNLESISTTVTAIAYCGPGPAPVEKLVSIKLASGAGGTARATCPAGTQLLFGGEIATAQSLSSRAAHIFSFALSAESTSRWSVAAANGGGATGSLTAIAYCR